MLLLLLLLLLPTAHLQYMACMLEPWKVAGHYVSVVHVARHDCTTREDNTEHDTAAALVLLIDGTHCWPLQAPDTTYLLPTGCTPSSSLRARCTVTHPTCRWLCYFCHLRGRFQRTGHSSALSCRRSLLT